MSSVTVQIYHLVEEKVSYFASNSPEKLFGNALRTGGIWKRRLSVLMCLENILKPEVFENDDVTTIL